MRHSRRWSNTLLIIAVISVTAAGIAYAVRSLQAEADRIDSGLPEPVVPGRQLVPIEADGVGVSGTTYCEFDARVTVEGQTVVEVESQSGSKPVAVGETLVELMDTATEGAGDRHVPERGPLGYRYSNVLVYWGDDGRLHQGCAPESIAIRN